MTENTQEMISYDEAVGSAYDAVIVVNEAYRAVLRAAGFDAEFVDAIEGAVKDVISDLLGEEV